MIIPELGKENGEKKGKINKRVLGREALGGEGWVAGLEARRGNPGVRRTGIGGLGNRRTGIGGLGNRRTGIGGLGNRRTGIGGLGNRGRNELGSWGLEHWSWGGSGNVPGGRTRRENEGKKNKIISQSPQANSVIKFTFLYKTESLSSNTAGITTQKAKNISARIAGSGGLL